MLNSHWLTAQAAFLYADEAATSVEACESRLVAAYFLGSLKVQGRLGQVGGGARTGTQFRYLSQGGRVTSPPRKTTRRPWRVR